MPIFMQYEGIKGDVNSKGHDDGSWIELSSVQFGTSRAFTSSTAGGSDREGTTPQVSELVISKTADCSSTTLLSASLGFGDAAEGKKVQIDFVKTDTAGPEVYLTVKLENSLVSSFSTSSGGDRPSESISLNFTKIEYHNIGMKAKNDTGEPVRVEYDMPGQAGG